MNNPKQPLSIPRGNDVWLKLWLYTRDLQEDTIVRVPFLVGDEDEIEVRLQSKYSSVVMEYERDTSDDNAILAHLSHQTETHSYGLEVLLKRANQHLRSFDGGRIDIVESNSEANVVLTRMENRSTATVDVDLQVVFSSITHGKNSYELWKELPGNEDKTLQEYIDEVLDLNNVTERAAADHQTAANDHGTATADHQTASSDHEMSASDHQSAEAAERSRSQEEEQRAQNELSREQAERLRVQAEQLRVQAEQLRVQAELLRDQAEQQREALKLQTESLVEEGAHPAYVGADNYVYQYSLSVHDYIRTNIYVKGAKGDKGDPGKDFSIYSTFPTISAMEADKENVPLSEFVLIASSVEDADNAKLFVRSDSSTTGFVYLTDLSGAQGFKGDQGYSAYEIAVRHGYTGSEAEYNALYFDAVTAANSAASLANEKAALAQQKADLANENATLAQQKADLANEKAALADQKATLANSAAQGAENVNASINGTIITVTNRLGQSSSIDVVDSISGIIGTIDTVLDEINGEVI